MEYSIVITAVGDKEKAENLAGLAVENKLCACVQIQEVESFYQWKGKTETAREYVLNFKTRNDKLEALHNFIAENHPYELPEIIAVPIISGYAPYLRWIDANLTS